MFFPLLAFIVYQAELGNGMGGIGGGGRNGWYVVRLTVCFPVSCLLREGWGSKFLKGGVLRDIRPAPIIFMSSSPYFHGFQL